MVESEKAIVPNNRRARPPSAGSVRILVSKNVFFDHYSTIVATATKVATYATIAKQRDYQPRSSQFADCMMIAFTFAFIGSRF